MKEKAPRNRTLVLNDDEIPILKKEILTLSDLEDFSAGGENSFNSENRLADRESAPLEKILDKTINADILKALPLLPDEFADLIIIDPPYNLTKNFGGTVFNERSEKAYDDYLATWFPLVCEKLKQTGSLYICGDWKCTSSLQRVVQKELSILNRITWQREKGRGACANWKNSMEDIWFAVKNSNDYYFDVEAVKQKRRVIAPYKENGKPKDWEEESEGNFRLTYPSNFWDDISIPFWSMSENTDHPTQKSEKLYAKLILASSRSGDVVFDPFLGSGTASVVAKKLGRAFVGIELSEEYCLYAQKRLHRAETDKSIQGYSDGVFWERNTGAEQRKK